MQKGHSTLNFLWSPDLQTNWPKQTDAGYFDRGLVTGRHNNGVERHFQCPNVQRQNAELHQTHADIPHSNDRSLQFLEHVLNSVDLGLDEISRSFRSTPLNCVSLPENRRHVR